ncbi:MAG: hypothetical protein D6780_02545 [Candidatus Dadabacteria bacterium]|nr:MAG: hypothetical protein D6780_02545 [Candidatus Dadabacteria bacterium]
MEKTNKTFVSLSPFITELLAYWELTDNILGVSFKCDYPKEILQKPKVTASKELAPPTSQKDSLLATALCEDIVLINKLSQLKPDIIFTSLEEFSPFERLARLEALSLSEVGFEPHIYSAFPKYWEDILTIWKEIGKVAGVPMRGKDLADKIKAQLFDWIDNLYDRLKNKKVAVISKVSNNCLQAAGWWFSDLCRLSSTSYILPLGTPDKEISLDDLAAFRPDVLIIASREDPFKAVLKEVFSLTTNEKWENMPAAKKGAVFLLPETSFFYRPSQRLLQGLSVFISCLAGFDSGYIAPRDSFHRLRYIELHREKFL